MPPRENSFEYQVLENRLLLMTGTWDQALGAYTFSFCAEGTDEMYDLPYCPRFGFQEAELFPE